MPECGRSRKRKGHRLREIPAEEAYLDWKLGLITERLLPAEKRVEELSLHMERLKEKWLESERFWNGGQWEEEGSL